MESRDHEADARENGWVPLDEWKGDPEQWVDAEEFNDRGERFHGQLKAKVDRLSNEVSQLRETNKQFGEYHRQTLEKAKAERDSKIRELEAQRAQAINEGDGQTFTQTDQEINRLRSEADPQPPLVRQMHPNAKSWLDNNAWYENDYVLSKFADGVAEDIINAGFEPMSEAYFNELSRRTKEAFPDKFNNPARSQPSTVETGGRPDTKPTEDRSYDTLPAEAKAACERFIRDIPGFTKEEFVKNYDWD